MSDAGNAPKQAEAPSQKTILTVAITGNQTTLAQHPGLPCTPAQIASSAIEAAKAGAAIAHIHVRHDDGRPSMELGHYREVVDRIRQSGTDVLINLTTGPGQRFIPGDDDPAIAAPGTTLMHPLRRVEHISAIRPDICTLDLNTMWSGSSAVINPPRNIEIMAEVMRESGVRIELEVFDSGDIALAKHLMDKGVLDAGSLFQIVCGIRWGFEATADTLAYAVSLLPQNARWAAFGIGRHAFPFVAQSFLRGGHVRVGLEDAVMIEKGVLAPSNAAMAAKARQIVELLGGELATPAEARQLLGIAS
ncbi:MAG: 3-keto-5-aminohexanoate cleavage protein [Mesorhizobium sp.]